MKQPGESPSTPPSFLQKRGLAPEDEAVLLGARGLRRRVKEIYIYVRDRTLQVGNEFVPRKVPDDAEQKSKFWQMNNLRVDCRTECTLKAVDLQLLALIPQVLGPTGPRIFGDVEAVLPEDKCESWRWTFAPVGLAVHGPACSTQEEAFLDLCKIRARLYPQWHTES